MTEVMSSNEREVRRFEESYEHLICFLEMNKEKNGIKVAIDSFFPFEISSKLVDLTSQYPFLDIYKRKLSLKPPGPLRLMAMKV
jgi:hypothetical protein